MEASELRIGNVVCQGHYGPTPVSSYELHQYAHGLNGGSVADYLKEWEPIPLTEEWLVKFSFEKHTKYSFSGIYRDLKIINRHGWFDAIFGTEVLCSVRYLHQLQNLYFALFGEELTITQ